MNKLFYVLFPTYLIIWMGNKFYITKTNFLLIFSAYLIIGMGGNKCFIS